MYFYENPFYREKDEEVVYGKCRNCVHYAETQKMCLRYNMISEPYQNCKSYREDLSDNRRTCGNIS